MTSLEGNKLVTVAKPADGPVNRIVHQFLNGGKTVQVTIDIIYLEGPSDPIFYLLFVIYKILLTKFSMKLFDDKIFRKLTLF